VRWNCEQPRGAGWVSECECRVRGEREGEGPCRVPSSTTLRFEPVGLTMFVPVYDVGPSLAR
jgi:hypothetical protein